MAAINDLINQIDDLELRERIKTEVDKLSKQKKFGLVFETMCLNVPRSMMSQFMLVAK